MAVLSAREYEIKLAVVPSHGVSMVKSPVGISSALIGFIKSLGATSAASPAEMASTSALDSVASCSISILSAAARWAALLAVAAAGGSAAGSMIRGVFREFQGL